ncbi:peptidoglycan endopeptidase [Candidatus Aerophobetes bacterium]|nr:peptidoglycan endopeptidase [Candidatus Aerophobetes bacterium]
MLADDAVKYAVALLPTPVLNTPHFADVFGGSDGKTLRMDKENKILELEFISFPQTVFNIEEVIKKGTKVIYKITTDDYPYSSQKGYFVDARFVKVLTERPPNRLRQMPPQERIIFNLLSAQGSSYLWGGNWKDGIPEMLSYYKPTYALSEQIQARWILKGFDCSGLLYYATDGYTPRNTSSLVNYGLPVKIADLNMEEIVQKVEPLDIIVWIGHVIIILDKERVIESRLKYENHEGELAAGVRIRALKEVLRETWQKRIPVDSYAHEVGEGRNKFVIRRWFGHIEGQQYE